MNPESGRVLRSSNVTTSKLGDDGALKLEWNQETLKESEDQQQ